MAIFTSPKPTTEITFACREDRKAILAVNAVLERPWPEADLGYRVGDCLTFGLVAYRRAALLGFAFYRQSATLPIPGGP